jgi:hypothetical protein
MEQPIEVIFQMTPEMYQRVTRDLLRFSFKQKRLWIIVAILLGLLALTQMLTSDGLDPDKLIAYGPMLLLFGIIWLLVIRFMPGRLIAKSRFPDPHPLRYTFTEAGAKISTATSESTIQWAGYVKVEETEEWLLLFQNKMLANPVLKAAFQAGDLERLRGFLRGKGLMKQGA